MKRAALTVIKPDKDAIQIGELYQKARLSLVESVRFAIACGQRLKAKQDSLPHGAWLPWLRDNAEVLGFDTPRTAQRLMALAANTTLASHLNEATAITYSRQVWGHDSIDSDSEESSEELSDSGDDVDLDSLLRDDQGQLTPKARAFIREVRVEKTLAKRAIRDAREVALARKQLAPPQKKYGVIYADPEYHFEVGSDASMSTSHPANEYHTSPIEEIAARPVADIAADDCVLFQWTTVPHLDQALWLMRQWGFVYKSHFAWIKQRTGTGYWNLNQHEILLVGTRGNIPAPAPGRSGPL